MLGKGCGKGGTRKHTPITSGRQRGKFGRELGLRRAGKKGEMPGITEEELASHLHESAGKKLPKRARSRADRVFKKKG